MKCIVRKLSEVVNDATLPVLPDVTLKSFAKTTIAEQYVDVTAALSGFGYSRIKFVMKCIIPNQNLACAMNTTNSYVSVDVVGGSSDSTKKLRVHYANTDAQKEMNIGDIVTVVLDGYSKNIEINGESTSVSAVSTSTPAYVKLLGYESMSLSSVNLLKISEFKIVNGETDEVISSLVPAVYNGVACLYDTVNSTPYYANTGELQVE